MKRGFTLIELLIVIGILAILATAVTLALNPANLLKEARDIQRLSDLRTVHSAIGLYLARTPSPELYRTIGVCAQGSNDNSHLWTATADYPTGGNYQLTSIKQPFRFPAVNPLDPDNTDGVNSGVLDPAKLRQINNEGWIPIALDQTSGGAGIPKLPVDPVNDASQGSLGNPAQPGYYYAYQCYGLTYEINANMESQKYGHNGGGGNEGAKDVEGADGGTIGCYGVGANGRCSAEKALDIYEIGNDPGLDL